MIEKLFTGMLSLNKTKTKLYDKSCLQGFQPGPTLTGLYSHRRWLEALNFGFRKQRDCTIYVVKTKALIICVVTLQLIFALVFAYDKAGFLMSPPRFRVVNFLSCLYCIFDNNIDSNVLKTHIMQSLFRDSVLLVKSGSRLFIWTPG